VLQCVMLCVLQCVVALCCSEHEAEDLGEACHINHRQTCKKCVAVCVAVCDAVCDAACVLQCVLQ